MKKMKTISSALSIGAFILAISIGSYISPLSSQAATKAGNETANQFDGTYSSVVGNRPDLSGTMVIDGLAVSYYCPLSDSPVSDVQFTRNTILFRLTAGGTTYTFLGIYSVDANRKKRFKGIVGKDSQSPDTSAFAPRGGKSALFPSVNSFLGVRPGRNLADTGPSWDASGGQ
jgi:hypothetical protein